MRVFVAVIDQWIDSDVDGETDLVSVCVALRARVYVLEEEIVLVRVTVSVRTTVREQDGERVEESV